MKRMKRILMDYSKIQHPYYFDHGIPLHYISDFNSPPVIQSLKVYGDYSLEALLRFATEDKCWSFGKPYFVNC
jgi:hypothetical protein